MIKILTLTFEPDQQGFNDEALQQFLAGKTINNMHPEFFQLHGQAYWTVWIDYEPVLTVAEKVKSGNDFNAVQQQLLSELQQWRREKADREKIPVYIIATNKELTHIVATTPKTLEGLRQIQGFGQKKTQRHGKEILAIVKRFAEICHQHENSDTNNKPEE